MSFSPELNGRVEQAKQAERAQQQAIEARAAEEQRIVDERRQCFEHYFPDLHALGQTTMAAYARGQLKPTTTITKLGDTKFRDWRHRQAYQESTTVITGWSITRCRVLTPGTPSQGRTATGELDFGAMNTSAYQDVIIGTNGRSYLVEHQGPSTSFIQEKFLLDRRHGAYLAETTSLSQNPLPLRHYVHHDDLRSFPLEAELLEGMTAFMRRSHLLSD